MKKCVSVLTLIAILGLVVPSTSVLSEVPGLYIGTFSIKLDFFTYHGAELQPSVSQYFTKTWRHSHSNLVNYTTSLFGFGSSSQGMFSCAFIFQGCSLYDGTIELFAIHTSGTFQISLSIII